MTLSNIPDNLKRYCQDKAAPLGSDNYYRLRFAPETKRPILLACMALWETLSALPHKSTEPDILYKQIMWWKSEFKRFTDGHATHPIMQTLALSVQDRSNLVTSLEHLLLSSEQCLEAKRYKTFQQLLHYYHQSAGTLEILYLTASHASVTPQHIEYAKTLSQCIQFVQTLNHLRQDITRGYLFLAEDDLAHYEVTNQQLYDLNMTTGLKTLLHDYCLRAKASLKTAITLITPDDMKYYAHGIIRAQLALAQANEIAKNGFPLFDCQIYLPAHRKVWIAWRTFRKLCKHGEAKLCYTA